MTGLTFSAVDDALVDYNLAVGCEYFLAEDAPCVFGFRVTDGEEACEEVLDWIGDGCGWPLCLLKCHRGGGWMDKGIKM